MMLKLLLVLSGVCWVWGLIEMPHLLLFPIGVGLLILAVFYDE